MCYFLKLAGCMAALQAEHFLQLHGSSFESANGDAASDAPTANGNVTALENSHLAEKQPVAAL